MRHHVFTFHGTDLVARADGALYWPAEGALIVADLHLGKADRLARRGGALLPPYGEADTLDRLAAALTATQARRVIVLGDGFDDAAALASLPTASRERLARLAAGRDWLWLAGNHDGAADWAGAGLAGRTAEDCELRGITLRHVASRGPDISAHYHPAVRFMGVRRPAFLIGEEHLILPAFGCYTGGLDADEPALARLFSRGLAVLTGARALALPWPLPESRRSSS
jgi:uncharacterized protein